MPLPGGDYRLVSPDGTFVYEYDWTPDGKGFVGTAAEGDGDNQWWVASLRALPDRRRDAHYRQPEDCR